MILLNIWERKVRLNGLFYGFLKLVFSPSLMLSKISHQVRGEMLREFFIFFKQNFRTLMRSLSNKNMWNCLLSWSIFFIWSKKELMDIHWHTHLSGQYLCSLFFLLAVQLIEKYAKRIGLHSQDSTNIR